MARINRSDVIQKAVNDLSISQSGEKIPNETLDKVQLTYSLNKQFSSFVLSTGSTSTGSMSVTLPSVSAGADTYITGINYSYVKDATCDVATGTLVASVTPDASNVSTNIVRLSVLTTTAQQDNVALVFPYPLKVKNGTTIGGSNTFSVGSLSRSITVTGFTTSSN